MNEHEKKYVEQLKIRLRIANLSLWSIAVLNLISLIFKLLKKL